MSRDSGFSFPAYRRLWKYLGEADAMVELTELAARSFTTAAEASGHVAAFVASASEKFGVRVNLPEVSNLHTHLYRHYIVTVYQSAECFLYEFRTEHIGLYKKEWTGDRHDVDPLSLVLRNLGQPEEKATDAVGRDLVTRFQYYRSVRNWVVHTKESDTSKPETKFDKISEYSKENRERYASLSAPNKPNELTFDDFVLFSRQTKHLAAELCRLAEPPEDHWFETFQGDMNRFRRLRLSPERMRNAIAGRLRTEFGLNSSNADWIAEKIQKKI